MYVFYKRFLSFYVENMVHFVSVQTWLATTLNTVVLYWVGSLSCFHFPGSIHLSATLGILAFMA